MSSNWPLWALPVAIAVGCLFFVAYSESKWKYGILLPYALCVWGFIQLSGTSGAFATATIVVAATVVLFLYIGIHVRDEKAAVVARFPPRNHSSGN